MKLKTIALMSLLTLTSACSLAWWGSFNKIDGDANMVKYEYELASLNQVSMDDAAYDHCNQYNKDAVQTRIERANYEYTATYQCVARNGIVSQ